MQDTHGRVGIVVTHNHCFCALHPRCPQHCPAAGISEHDIFTGSCGFLHTGQVDVQGDKRNIFFFEKPREVLSAAAKTSNDDVIGQFFTDALNILNLAAAVTCIAARKKFRYLQIMLDDERCHDHG